MNLPAATKMAKGSKEVVYYLLNMECGITMFLNV